MLKDCLTNQLIAACLVGRHRGVANQGRNMGVFHRTIKGITEHCITKLPPPFPWQISHAFLFLTDR